MNPFDSASITPAPNLRTNVPTAPKTTAPTKAQEPTRDQVLSNTSLSVDTGTTGNVNLSGNANTPPTIAAPKIQEAVQTIADKLVQMSAAAETSAQQSTKLEGVTTPQGAAKMAAGAQRAEEHRGKSHDFHNPHDVLKLTNQLLQEEEAMLTQSAMQEDGATQAVVAQVAQGLKQLGGNLGAAAEDPAKIKTAVNQLQAAITPGLSQLGLSAEQIQNCAQLGAAVSVMAQQADAAVQSSTVAMAQMEVLGAVSDLQTAVSGLPQSQQNAVLSAVQTSTQALAQGTMTLPQAQASALQTLSSAGVPLSKAQQAAVGGALSAISSAAGLTQPSPVPRAGMSEAENAAELTSDQQKVMGQAGQNLSGFTQQLMINTAVEVGGPLCATAMLFAVAKNGLDQQLRQQKASAALGVLMTQLGMTNAHETYEASKKQAIGTITAGALQVTGSFAQAAVMIGSYALRPSTTKTLGGGVAGGEAQTTETTKMSLGEWLGSGSHGATQISTIVGGVFTGVASIVQGSLNLEAADKNLAASKAKVAENAMQSLLQTQQSASSTLLQLFQAASESSGSAIQSRQSLQQQASNI